MKRTQETFKVVYTFTTGHDPIPAEDTVYVWAIEGNQEDAKRVFRKTTQHSNYNFVKVTSFDPPVGETVISL